MRKIISFAKKRKANFLRTPQALAVGEARYNTEPAKRCIINSKAGGILN